MLSYRPYLMFNNWYLFVQNFICLVYLMRILLNLSTYIPNTPRIWMSVTAFIDKC